MKFKPTSTPKHGMNWLAGWFLIQADDIASRVAETRCDLRSICADRLGDFAACTPDRLHRGRDAIDHDVEEDARTGVGRAI